MREDDRVLWDHVEAGLRELSDPQEQRRLWLSVRCSFSGGDGSSRRPDSHRPSGSRRHATDPQQPKNAEKSFVTGGLATILVGAHLIRRALTAVDGLTLACPPGAPADSAVRVADIAQRRGHRKGYRDCCHDREEQATEASGPGHVAQGLTGGALAARDVPLAPAVENGTYPFGAGCGGDYTGRRSSASRAGLPPTASYSRRFGFRLGHPSAPVCRDAASMPHGTREERHLTLIAEVEDLRVAFIQAVDQPAGLPAGRQ